MATGLKLFFYFKSSFHDSTSTIRIKIVTNTPLLGLMFGKPNKTGHTEATQFCVKDVKRTHHYLFSMCSKTSVYMWPKVISNLSCCFCHGCCCQTCPAESHCVSKCISNHLHTFTHSLDKPLLRRKPKPNRLSSGPAKACFFLE